MSDYPLENEFHKKLLLWFDENQRRMPWRETNDPYWIWISEIMLQQTRVETVIPYFQRFIKRFPTVYDLAEASEEEVLKYWVGLGYYTRGRNLHKTSKKVVEEYNGNLPDDFKTLIALPGIGIYTAGAILSIAYNQPIPAVDGNVLRVLSRIKNISDDIYKKQTIDKVNFLISKGMPKDRCGDFNEALMELGAVVCTLKKPKCGECPVGAFCEAFSLGLQEHLPIRKNKRSIQELNKLVLWIEENNMILVEKKPPKGLLGGLWSLPTIDIRREQKEISFIEKRVNEEIGLKIKVKQFVGKEKHIFTHQKWNMIIFQCNVETASQEDMKRYQWIKTEKIQDMAFAFAYQKIIEKIQKDKRESNLLV